jgi:hypothetical protein
LKIKNGKWKIREKTNFQLSIINFQFNNSTFDRKKKGFFRKNVRKFSSSLRYTDTKEGSTMDKVDKQMEKRVWQRVQSRQSTPAPLPRQESLKPWILVAQETTAVLRALQLQLIGKQWDGLRQLECDSARIVHTLRGISAMQGQIVRLSPIPTPKEPPRRALEKSFHRTRRIREELERRFQEEEYGLVFRNLAGKCDELCTSLAELIGRLEG